MKTVVIIGASNVTLGLPLIWNSLTRVPSEARSKRQASEHSLTQASGQPRRLLVAAGHGRSFGLPSTVFTRTLPSLLECGLWRALTERDDDSREVDQIVALVTDVGNDILYGAHPSQIADWVTDAVKNLIAQRVEVAVTQLPVQSLRRLSRQRFLFFRRLLFPSSRLTFETAQEHVEILNSKLLDLCRHHDLPCLKPETHWYGLDPIHIRRRFRQEAWTTFLSPLIPGYDSWRPSIRESQIVWRKRPLVRWRGRKRLESPQPVLTQNESELWLF